jgi:hypothetical protein
LEHSVLKKTTIHTDTIPDIIQEQVDQQLGQALAQNIEKSH